ncbi:nicotinate phosphoribosyltransferase [Panacibacter ginsenosidivorans]|uniref:Nicotinate phosphoribosyltransferase n=1 Tax=Panacibacter ginsenosidivorans TaxID=1813871 RepID=A0A5B8VCD8_9BACT|nr:nicotinate phosphoribosyltransferase [Panacibacter ginsenosidivorans]QEC69197.1 nicotinate phosphoribosyltransferase [Panacibacter ginsenosidivorans]
MLSFSISGSYTDLYEITMSETYFMEGRKDDTACFDYFFRKVPNKGGYVVFAGLQDVLNILTDLHFTDDDLSFLRELKFNSSFIEYLKRFQFRGNVYSCMEGEIIFPNCPILRVEGNIIEAQLVETLLLNILNFESLIATKASRMRYVAGNRLLSDFGLRRAQGMGGILAARGAIIGGFESTSNVYAAQLYRLPAAGTMAHSFIESYDSELEAFRAFAKARPDDCIFLVDTYDTLKSGVPNAITVAKEMESNGHRAGGIRLDSGDLAYLSKVARNELDEAGLHYMKIVASNQLDEYVIKSLTEQGAQIDIFGVGTRLVTGQPDAALDGVYKLSMASGKPRLKLSETLEKITLPGIKHTYRVITSDGLFFGADVVTLTEEQQKTDIMYHPFEAGKSLVIGNFQQEPLLQKVMEKGKIISQSYSLKDIAGYAKRRLLLLPTEYKRFENPHLYKVGVSKKLLALRDQLKDDYKK